MLRRRSPAEVNRLGSAHARLGGRGGREQLACSDVDQQAASDYGKHFQRRRRLDDYQNA